MEQAIVDGRVSVNGKLAKLGDRVEADDEIRVDGRRVQFTVEDETRRRVLVYYKPEGEICSRQDPEGRPTVFDALPQTKGERWVMVGRLDINSTGLLLFTTDGELANRLMHPSSEVEREYAVRVMGEVTPEIKKALTDGVQLEDGPARFERMAELGGEGFNRWWQVVVKEGRNREVRRLFESQELKVSRLLRTRYGSITLPRTLKTGRWIELDKPEIDALSEQVELRPRRGTGLYGLAKRRTEKMQESPLPARRGGYLRQQRRDSQNKPEE
jgi:23S rRNA pseudouridine2605 synthase